jgi:hypothetical protein
VRLARAAAFVLALAALAAAGATVAVVLLSTVGGTPERDPVGRLTPVLPGLPVATVTVTDPAETTEPADTTAGPAQPPPTDGDGDGDDD